MTTIPEPRQVQEPTGRKLLLDPGMDLTLRPMKYPHFFDRFKDAIKNTWTVDEDRPAHRPGRPGQD